MVVLENVKFVCNKCNDVFMMNFVMSVTGCKCGHCEVMGHVNQMCILKGRDALTIVDESTYVLLNNNPILKRDGCERMN